MNGCAAGLNRIFGPMRTTPEDEIIVRCYSEKNYGGYCIPLGEGTYSQPELALYGIAGNDISSIEILNENYRVKVYTSVNCTGSYLIRQVSTKTFSTSYDNKICSMKVELKPGVGIGEIDADEDILLTAERDNILVENAEGERLCIYDTAGKLISQSTIVTASQAVSIQALPRGNYIIRVADKAIKVLR